MGVIIGIYIYIIKTIIFIKIMLFTSGYDLTLTILLFSKPSITKIRVMTNWFDACKIYHNRVTGKEGK